MAPRGERHTAWDQSYAGIWCVCACVLSVWILVLSGSLRVYRGKGSRGQWAERRSEGGPKQPVDWPYQCRPHIWGWWRCYPEPSSWTMMVISSFSAKRQTVRRPNSLKRRQRPLDSNLSVRWLGMLKKITASWRGHGVRRRNRDQPWIRLQSENLSGFSCRDSICT